MSDQNQNNLKAADSTHSSNVKEGMKIQREMKNLSDGQWTILQELLIDIQATNEVYRITENKNKVPLTKEIETLKERITAEYADDEETRNTLLNGIPSYPTIRSWVKSEEWQKAVMGKIRGNHIFDNVHRVKMYEVIFKRATDKGDMRAAELYFKLSGDLDKAKDSEKERAWDTLNYYNAILHRKNR